MLFYQEYFPSKKSEIFQINFVNFEKFQKNFFQRFCKFIRFFLFMHGILSVYFINTVKMYLYSTNQNLWKVVAVYVV